MSIPLDPSAIASTAMVLDHTPCRKCSYNLRALPVAGNCPECGVPIGTAVFGNLLKFSLPQWLRNLARDANLVYWGCTLIVLGVVLIPTIVFSFMAGPLPSSPNLIIILPIASLLGIFAGAVMAIVGWWLLT